MKVRTSKPEQKFLELYTLYHLRIIEQDKQGKMNTGKVRCDKQILMAQAL